MEKMKNYKNKNMKEMGIKKLERSNIMKNKRQKQRKIQ